MLKLAFSSNGLELKPTCTKFRRSDNTRIVDAVQALALCHNVTPVYDSNENSETSKTTDIETKNVYFICMCCSDRFYRV